MKKLIIFLFSSLLLLGGTFSFAHAIVIPQVGTQEYSDLVQSLLKQIAELQKQVAILVARQNVQMNYSPEQIIPIESPSGSEGTSGGTTGGTPPSSVATNFVFDWRSGTDVFGASNVSKTGMKFEWSPMSARTSSYALYRGRTVVYQGGLTSFTDNSLKCETEYTYKIVGTQAVGSRDSRTNTTKTYGPLTVKTSACESYSTLTAPTLILTPLSKSGIKASWNAVNGAVEYYVFKNGSYLKSTQNTSISDTGLTCGTSYSYTVAAYNNRELSPQSNIASMTTSACGTTEEGGTTKGITLIAPDGNTQKPGDSLNVRWTSSGFTDGEKTLSVYKSNTLVETISRVVPVTANSYSWTIPLNFATGDYRIELKNNVSGIKSAFDEGLFSVTDVPTDTSLSAPTNLSAKVDGKNVILSWSAVSSATAYNIYRDLSTVSRTSAQYLDFANGVTTYTDVNVCSGKTGQVSYMYYVDAYAGTSASGATQRSARSAGATATVDCSSSSTFLSAPTNLKAIVSGTNVVLSWGAVSGATAYNIYRDLSTVSRTSAQYLDWKDATTYTDATVCSGKTGQVTYMYYIDAYSGTTATAVTNRSARSQGTTATVDCSSGSTSLSAPTNLKAIVSGTNVILSWSAVSSATAYNIYRDLSTVSRTSAQYLDFANGVTTYTDVNVCSGKTGQVSYMYYVDAYAGTSASGATQRSARSAGATATVDCSSSSTFLSAPTGLSGAAVSQTSNLIKWNAMTGADGYNIYKLGTLLARTLKGTMLWQDNGLQCGTTHQYSVEAFKYDASSNVIGSGNISSPIYVQTLGCGSANPFSIQVLSPNGGQTYKLGDVVNISWKTVGYGAGNSIALSVYEYRSDNSYYGIAPVFGETVSNIIGSDGIVQDNGDYKWTIPQSVVLGNYIIWISSAVGVRDTSDNPFTITSLNAQATLLNTVQIQLKELRQILLNLR